MDEDAGKETKEGAEGRVRSIDFFRRIAKYLRSIGYYGDSPFMMANYGSSEYSQAFSRVGSLFRNVYIVNDDLEIQDLATASQADSPSGKRASSLEINYNNTPIDLPEHGGIVASVHYLPILEKILAANPGQEGAPKSLVRHCLRTTIVTKRPLLVSKEVQDQGHSYGSLATFTVPPETSDEKQRGQKPYIGNKNPIRIYQQNHHIEAAPAGTYLVLISM